jgi:hypothetical protein
MFLKPELDPGPEQVSIGPKATGSGLFEELGASAADEDIAARIGFFGDWNERFLFRELANDAVLSAPRV